ncbi:MAG: hypothetical protein OSB09_02840 [Planctomycetota bacterium]|nr:hypothetical protein [Planctomycetota bacterium]
MTIQRPSGLNSREWSQSWIQGWMRSHRLHSKCLFLLLIGILLAPEFPATVATAHQDPAAAAAATAEQESLRNVAVVIEIDQPINDKVVDRFDRTILQLVKQDVRYLIIQLSTPGGTIEASRRLAESIDNLSEQGITTFGWVPNGQQAYSGGTMVALACRHLVMGDNSRIGDVQPIDLFGNELPEKIQTTVRADMRRWARDRGYPIALAEAMVTKEITVLKVQTANGRTLYLTEQEYQDLPTAERNSSTIHRIVERGEILTIDEKEAFEYGFISHICLTREQLLTDFGLTQLRALNANEALGEQRIGAPGGFALDSFREWGRFIKFLLIFGAAVALVIEFKLPGVGLGAALSLGFLCLFLFSSFADGNVGWIEISLFALGLFFLALELFVIPGFGISGILGLVIVCVSLALCYQPVDQVLSLKQLSKDTLQVGGGLTTGLFTLLILAYILPSRSKASGSIIDHSTLESDSRAVASPGFEGSTLEVGQQGSPLQDLHPSGKVDFEGVSIDVVSEGGFIEKQIRVEVVEVEGNRVVVRPVVEEA